MFLSFSPNGRWLAAGNSDGSIKLWKRVDRFAER
jgi:WD40 repeat protein